MSADQPKPRVLIVDDAPVNINLLRGLLRPHYAVSFATDGPSALALALSTEARPDLVLLDVSMPEMDGHEVCRRLKASPVTSAIPVIFITVQNDEDDQLAGLNLGAIDYITKPFSTHIVLARVKNHIEFALAKQRLDAANALLDVKNHELELLLRTDQLTGLNNRHRLDEALHMGVTQAKRYGRDLSVVLLDVDRFKAVNDTHGHQTGDMLLCCVARTLSGNVRETDILGRWGGEEFLILCPETPLPVAGVLAERLRALLASTPMPPVQRLSASFGVAAYQAGEDMPSLLRRADDAMYRAKHNGRNRVELATA